MFVDRVKIKVKGGNGGNGIVSMRREKFVPLGGPDGGSGGNGGNVILKADSNKSTLLDLRYNKQIFAEHGGSGKTKKMSGKTGSDQILSVPVGTVVKDEEGSIIADLNEHDQEVVVAKGGRGGKGNWAFMSNKYPAPDFAQQGEIAEVIEIEIELKLLADVGLVGFPSVGKSTFLSVVTKAKPEIADYPFTTITPNLGVVSSKDGRSFTIADLPGLIEGASQGKGLGHQFLRHIERTRVIVHMLDMGNETGRDPVEDYEIINNELNSYQYDLLLRPQVVVANKMDMPGAKENLERFRKAYPDLEVFETTTIFQEGVDLVLYKVADLLEDTPAFPLLEGESQGVVYKYVEEREDFKVNNLGNGRFELLGDKLLREFRMLDFESENSAYHFARRLRVMGVDARLRALGAKDGDTIIIDNYEFEFVD
ncbi:MAG TPA: GTPase ObgE [Erysipelotrichaceae bacterium]|nr:GTPase ObgE [Erysipelotrichaceae bacterium]